MTQQAPYYVAVVDDDPNTLGQVISSIRTVFEDSVDIQGFRHWLAVEDWLNGIPVLPDCAIVDINLRQHHADYNPLRLSEQELHMLTEYDGFRVLALFTRHSTSTRVGLFTGHEPAANALDKFDTPDGLFWVLKKGEGNT